MKPAAMVWTDSLPPNVQALVKARKRGIRRAPCSELEAARHTWTFLHAQNFRLFATKCLLGQLHVSFAYGLFLLGV